jgi:glycosyltransferase involved in cell wall biosynthesis
MISICLATYNGEKFISQQISSILHQLNLQDELIISDDGSTDETLSIIETFSDHRIKIYRNSFHSPVRNFEYLICKAKGDIIFLSDQDDVWATDKVRVFLEYFHSCPGVSLILSDIQIIDKEGFSINKEFFPYGFKSRLIENIFSNNFIGCSIAFRKEIKKFILPFPKNLPMHDWWIGLCSIMFSKVHFIENKLTLYRRHDSNVTKNEGGVIYQKLFWRIYLVTMLFRRFLREQL